MKIIANAKWPDFFSWIGEADYCLTLLPISHSQRHPKILLSEGKKRDPVSFSGHQPFPRATKSQLDSKRGRDQNVDFPGFDFLQIACGKLRSFGQCVLRQFSAHPLPAHVCAEDLDSLPFFLGNGHDILHRFYAGNMNDTYIVKRFLIWLDTRLGGIKNMVV